MKGDILDTTRLLGRIANSRTQSVLTRLPKSSALIPQVTSMVWSSLDDLLLTGHDNGDLVQWDVKTGKKLKMSSDHQKTITDMQISNDASMLITASKVPAQHSAQ